MTLTWDKVVQIAKERRGLTEAALRQRLGEKNVQSATITNWKSRGVPVGRYQLLSGLIGASTDELHGKAPKAAPGSAERSEDDPSVLAEKIGYLDDSSRNLVISMINELLQRPSSKAKPRKRGGG